MNTKSGKRISMGEEVWAERQRLRDNERAKKYRGLHVIEWHRRTKKALIEYKGGKCQRCGYCKDFASVYHFHHRDASQKDFTISSKTWALERLKAEVDKCDLLCGNCHSEVHEIEELKKAEVRRAAFESERAALKKRLNCNNCGLEFVQKRCHQKYCCRECCLKDSKKGSAL
jgi:hypothetical protein